MAALTADRKTTVIASEATRTRVYKVAADAVIFFGAIVALDADGYLVPAANTAGLIVVGIAQEAVDNTDGADGDLECTVQEDIVAEVNNDGAGAVVQATVGRHCFILDDQTVRITEGNAVIGGIVKEVSATKVWIHIDPAHGALVAAALALVP
jgi:hypothetical protein